MGAGVAPTGRGAHEAVRERRWWALWGTGCRASHPTPTLLPSPRSSLASDGALVAPTPEARRAVAAHNGLTAAIVQWEAAWAAASGAAADAALAGLAAPLVAERDGKLAPALDRRVLAAVADARWLARLGWAPPPRAAAAAVQEDRLARLLASLSHALDAKAALMARLPARVAGLVSTHAAAVDDLASSAGARLTWASPGAAAFATSLSSSVDGLCDLAGAVEHALAAGVDARVAALRAAPLLPPAAPVPEAHDQFRERAVQWTKKAGQELVDG